MVATSITRQQPEGCRRLQPRKITRRGALQTRRSAGTLFALRVLECVATTSSSSRRRPHRNNQPSHDEKKGETVATKGRRRACAREIFSGIYLDEEESGTGRRRRKRKKRTKRKSCMGLNEIRASRRPQVDSDRTGKKIHTLTRRGTPTSFKRAESGTRPTEGADFP